MRDYYGVDARQETDQCSLESREPFSLSLLIATADRMKRKGGEGREGGGGMKGR